MKTLLSVFAALSLSPSLFATFHLMQIEQVIGGVHGDPSAQAIQLRMRSGGQTSVTGTTLIARDAAGNNPITLITIPSIVTNGSAGDNILLTTTAFNSLMSSVPGYATNFTLTNPIPASYLNGGKVTFQSGATIYWSVAFGAYTGANTGSTTNDADGNFGLPTVALPTNGRQGIRFTGAASALSTTNLADYALTADPASVRNNARASFTIPAAAEIVVEQPAGTNLTDGAGSVAFGMVTVGSSSAATVFTIRNIGSANLTLGAITTDGTNAADFAASAPGSATVTPGNSTTFTVIFSPAAAGSRSAAIHIANNDANENPFDIALTGTGLTPQESWRLTFFGTTANSGTAADTADPDGDGGNNLFEYVAGLSPVDPASRFTVRVEAVAGNPGQNAIIFRPTVAGRTYAVKMKASLTDPTWAPLTSFTTSDNGTERTVTDLGATGAGMKFYQVEITKP